MLRHLAADAAMLLTTGVGHTQDASSVTPGFAACSVIFPSKLRLICTNPLPAISAQTANLVRAFAASMQQRICSQEPTIEMLGDRHWEPISEKAVAYRNTHKRNVVAKGMAVAGMSYTPVGAD